MFFSSFRNFHGFVARKKFDLTLAEIHALGLMGSYKVFSQLFMHLPPELIKHREFFEKERRGFGERAFHSAWYWLFLSLYSKRVGEPLNLLEIGVYRGQTITLWALIGRALDLKMNVLGLSPFEPAGDSVSKYDNISYCEDVVSNARAFDVEESISLVKAYSNTIEGKKAIISTPWDLIYIDGSHDYPIVKGDYRNAIQGLRQGGFLVMDDSSLFVLDLPISMNWKGFKGHSGPSKVLAEIHDFELVHVMSVGHLNFFVKVYG